MATLILPKTYINLMSTGASVSGKAALGRTEDYSIHGDVRTYAGGRRRAITSAGVAGNFKFTLLLVPRSTVDTLYLWMSQLVQVRDTRGRRFFGTYFTLSVVEVTANNWIDCTNTGLPWNVGIDLSVTTTNEGV